LSRTRISAAIFSESRPRGAAALACLAWLLLAPGCGAPGDPLPPLLNIPARASDLEAVQRAGELIVRWTPPHRTTEGYPVKDLDRAEVVALELEEESVGEAAFDRARVLDTVRWPLEPAAAAPGIERRLPPSAAPGQRIAVAVRHYNRRGRSEGVSNVVVLEIGVTPAAPQRLLAGSLADGIRLEWTPVPGAAGYRIYRGLGEKPDFRLLSETSASPFHDPDFLWDRPQAYFLRAFTRTSTGPVESADTPVVVQVPRDAFPPSPPAGLQFVAGETSVDLSWNLSPEPDAAGYHLYRRGETGESERLTTAPLATPAFTDREVERQRQYFYTVSAVDHKGNESPRSAPAVVRIP